MPSGSARSSIRAITCTPMTPGIRRWPMPSISGSSPASGSCWGPPNATLPDGRGSDQSRDRQGALASKCETVSVKRRACLSQPAPAHQIDREAAELVPAFVVLAPDAVEARRFEFAGERGQRLAARVGGGKLRDDAFQHPRAAQVQPGQVVGLAIGHVADQRWLQIHARQKRGEPPGEFGGQQNPAHRVGFGQARREEVFARRFVGKRAIPVLQVVVPRARFHYPAEFRVAGDAGVIQHQAHGESGVVVLAGADGVLQFRQPLGDARGDRLFQGAQRGGPLARLRVVEFLHLGGQLQQPGQAVGALEGIAATGVEIDYFLRDVGGREAARHGAARFGRERRLRKQARQADQQPVAVDRRMPVVAAVERRGQFARRLHIGIGVQGMRDLVGVRFVDAIERQSGEARRLRLVEIGIRHEASTYDNGESQEPEHDCMLAGGAPRASEEPMLTFCLQACYRFVRIVLVNVISKRGLLEKASKYPDATVAVQDWFDAARAANWRNLEEVRRTYPATDMVGALAVFDIKGNSYRLIARMAFPYRRIYIKEFLTHAEYDKGAWKKWLR